MKETKNLLMGVFVAGIVLPLTIVCLYETEVVVPGLFATDKQSEFLMTFLMELMTLGCAFMALRLFKFEKIHQELISGKAVALRKWGVVRLVMLLLPLWSFWYFVCRLSIPVRAVARQRRKHETECCHRQL